MSVSKKYGLYAVLLDATGLPGVTNVAIQTASEVRGEPTAGNVYARFQSLVAQKPTAEFTTLAIVTALDNIGLTGSSIADLAAGLSLFLQKHLTGSTRAGATSHRKFNVTEGIIVPRTLSVEHQGDASLIYDVVIIYDGANDPIVITDSVTLPTDPGDAERFTLGPVTIGGVSLAQARSLEIAFGVNVVAEGADSEIWDQYASIESIQPALTLRGIDPEWMKAANIPLIGKAATHANTTVYLRKRAAGGTFVADVTAEHVKLTADGLATIETPATAGQTGPAETVLTLPLRYDGTNAPLVVNTASAIT